MLDENKDLITETPQHSEEVCSGLENPALLLEEMEPNQVVLEKEEYSEDILAWYQNNSEDSLEEGEELKKDAIRIEGIHSGQGDINVWKDAARKERRRRRALFWSITAVIIVIFAGIILAIFINKKPVPNNSIIDNNDDESASSIINIFGNGETTIERYADKTDARLHITRETGEVLTAQEVYEKVNPSVVTVIAYVTDNNAMVGTGIIMTEDGIVVTNAHVISGSGSCAIVLSSGEIYDAQLIGYDVNQDIAVLKAVDAQNLDSATFGDSDAVSVGDKVYAIGNPLGVELRGTFTDGIISAVNRSLTVDGTEMTVIQTNAALNNGNSGGPLINEYGQVIGINTLKMSNTTLTEATVEGLGFALPTSAVSFVVNDILETGEYSGTPVLGIQVITETYEDGTSQLVVYTVQEGYGAQEAGMLPGDIIIEADGEAIYETRDLLAVRRNHRVGEQMYLKILRDGQVIDIALTLYADMSIAP